MCSRSSSCACSARCVSVLRFLGKSSADAAQRVQAAKNASLNDMVERGCVRKLHKED